MLSPRQAFAIALVILVANDLAFIAATGTVQVFVLDYVSKALALLMYWLARRDVPIPSERYNAAPRLVVAFVGLVGVQNAAYVTALFALDPPNPFYDWPAPRHPWNILDLFFGVPLTVVAESLVFLPLAFGAIGGPVWRKVLMSGLMFGLAHWGYGWPLILAVTATGLAYAAVYAATRSVVTVMMAQFSVQLMIYAQLDAAFPR